jgi:hypothetical protein
MFPFSHQGTREKQGSGETLNTPKSLVIQIKNDVPGVLVP